MKNYDIAAVIKAYQTGTGDLALPAKAAWIRRVNIANLMKVKVIIDQAMREIHAKYSDDEHSVADENGERKVKPEYLEEFAKEQADVLMQDTDVEIKKISIEELGDVTLTDSQMDTLAFMIEE